MTVHKKHYLASIHYKQKLQLQETWHNSTLNIRETTENTLYKAVKKYTLITIDRKVPTYSSSKP